MNKKVYKYFSHEVLNLVFQRDGFVGVKCSFPRQYNDPYELFLGVDTNVPSDIMATYQEIVQELPQIPTTCFSNSPTVTPMWAHYAGNHSGFVLEFDVDSLKQKFEGIKICDVEYKDAPDGMIEECLHRAAMTKKPRHAVWLRQTVLSEAYFSKQTPWAYEQECRLIDFNEYVEEVAGRMILFVPVECLSRIIVGQNFPDISLGETQNIAKINDLEWYRANIGKVQSSPFLTSGSGGVFNFQNGEIFEVENICASCSEPVPEDKELCAWCGITETDRINAARGNPFRMMDHYGLLDGYFEEVAKIERMRK